MFEAPRQYASTILGGISKNLVLNWILDRQINWFNVYIGGLEGIACHTVQNTGNGDNGPMDALTSLEVLRNCLSRQPRHPTRNIDQRYSCLFTEQHQKKFLCILHFALCFCIFYCAFAFCILYFVFFWNFFLFGNHFFPENLQNIFRKFSENFQKMQGNPFGKFCGNPFGKC